MKELIPINLIPSDRWTTRLAVDWVPDRGGNNDVLHQPATLSSGIPEPTDAVLKAIHHNLKFQKGGNKWQNMVFRSPKIWEQTNIFVRIQTWR